MKNSLDLSRLSKLFQMELRMHKRIYFLLAVILFGIIILSMVRHYFIPDGIRVAVCSPFQFMVVAFIMTAICPFLLYNFVYHPTKGLTYAMLPATSLEKFISAWIQCVIVVPVLLFGALFLGLLFGNLTGLTIIWHDIVNPQFFTHYLTSLSFQAFALLGVFWFKRQKMGKTILTFALIGLGISIIAMCLLFVFKEFFDGPTRFFFTFDDTLGIVLNKWGPTGEAGPGRTFIIGVTDQKVIIGLSACKILAYFQYVLTPILPWTVAFFKFRRTQI